MTTTSEKKLIYIEGSISAGKSTLLKYIDTKYSEKVEVIYEPVELWRNLSGHNLLGNFYEDQKKNGFTLQVSLFYYLQILKYLI